MKRLLPAGLLLAMIGLLALSGQAAEAVRQGLKLCATAVIPSLFPFLVLSSLFVEIGGISLLGQRLQQITGRVLGCSGEGAGIFFLSLLGGYPVGPRLIGQLYRTGCLSQPEAEHLLLFCNNAGPAFILGLVGLGLFGCLRAGVALYLIHAAAAVLVSLLLRPAAPFLSARTGSTTPQPFAHALVHAIAGAGETMVQICSFVTFFYTILRLFADLTDIFHPLILGFVELTQGVTVLPSTPAGFVMAAVLLGWGGLSVHCQAAAVLAGTGLSLQKHLLGKTLQALLSALLAALATLLS